MAGESLYSATLMSLLYCFVVLTDTVNMYPDDIAAWLSRVVNMMKMVISSVNISNLH